MENFKCQKNYVVLNFFQHGKQETLVIMPEMEVKLKCKLQNRFKKISV